MNITEEQKAIEAALDQYRIRMDKITDDQFTITPAGGGWSYAEVYTHILKATIGSSISIEKCANPKTEQTTGGLKFFGWYLMLLGKFPPIKVKVPKIVEEKMPAEKISKEEAEKLLEKCHKRLLMVIPLLNNASKNSRFKHPRLGMLNAEQWFKFIRIHAQHHLKQLDRIDKKIKNV